MALDIPSDWLTLLNIKILKMLHLKLAYETIFILPLLLVELKYFLTNQQVVFMSRCNLNHANGIAYLVSLAVFVVPQGSIFGPLLNINERM